MFGGKRRGFEGVEGKVERNRKKRMENIIYLGMEKEIGRYEKL